MNLRVFHVVSLIQIGNDRHRRILAEFLLRLVFLLYLFKDGDHLTCRDLPHRIVENFFVGLRINNITAAEKPFLGLLRHSYRSGSYLFVSEGLILL